MSTPDVTWRASQADVLDECADAVAAALDHLANVEGVLELRRRDQLLTELRSLCGGLRAEQASMNSQARELRQHPDLDQLPMSLTTRHPRRTDDRRPVRAAGAATANPAD